MINNQKANFSIEIKEKFATHLHNFSSQFFVKRHFGKWKWHILLLNCLTKQYKFVNKVLLLIFIGLGEIDIKREYEISHNNLLTLLKDILT